MFVGSIAVGVTVAGVASDITNRIIGVGVVVGSAAGGAVAGASVGAAGGVGGGQAMQPVVAKTLLLAAVDCVEQGFDVAAPRGTRS